MSRDRKTQRGVALVYVAVCLIAFLGFAAVGIDLAHLAHTATEVQTVADAAARGGAVALGQSGGTPGVGITRAQFVAAKNYMNGVPSPAGDVLVDEGHYDSSQHQFQCCPSGSGYNSPCCQSSLNMGDWSCTQSNSCSTRGAVLAMPRTTVTNLLAGVLGNKTSTVDKVAVAAYSGPSQGCKTPSGCAALDWQCWCNHGVAPCMPLGAPSCQYTDPCLDQSCLPALTVSNGQTNTAAWVVPSSETASDNNLRPFMENGGCSKPGNGNNNAAPFPVSSTSDSINANNGIATSGNGNAFDLLRCVVGQHVACSKNSDCLGTNTCNSGICSYTPQGCTADANGNITGYGGNVFQIPIFELPAGAACSGPIKGAYQIVGFATVRITNVTLGGPVNVQTIPHTDTQTVQDGGGCFGTDCTLTMVE